MFQRSSFNRRMIVLFSLLFSNFFLLSVAVSVNADQSTKIDETIPWEVSNQGKEPTDVTTWRREIPGADVKQFRGEVLLNHPALHVLSAINNIQDLDKWVYFCRDSYKIDDTDNVYMEYKGVWPVASRYVALQNNFEIKGGVILINSVNIKGVGPQPKNMVRIQEFNNLFEVTPLGPNTTKLRFTT
ncbi:MAG: hypothetical protein P1U57_08415, partial [Oleibacter sp.]|nr:hypothetical protein [Thalassolituus sp.]